MQKLMYMKKKHDQTRCSSLKEVYNSVPCPNTLFLSPGSIYHTTWLGIFWKYKLCHQSLLIRQWTCHYPTLQAPAAHQGRHKPAQTVSTAQQDYPVFTDLGNSGNKRRTKLGPSLTLCQSKQSHASPACLYGQGQREALSGWHAFIGV